MSSTIVAVLAATRIRIPIHARDAGMRLDRYIHSKFSQLPHSSICRMLRKGDISLLSSGVHGALPVKATDIDTRIECGQILTLPSSLQNTDYTPDVQSKTALKRLAAANLTSADSERIRGWVLYADSDLIAINKPAKLPVQGGPGIHRALDSFLPLFTDIPNTQDEFHGKYISVKKIQTDPLPDFEGDSEKISNRARFLESLSPEERLLLHDGQESNMSADEQTETPRLVHRLDADTSGVMLLARHRHSAQRLTEMFRQHRYDKLYWALLFGRPKETQGIIDVPLVPIALASDGHFPASGSRAISAKTAYRALSDRSDGLATWMQFQPRTGRKHQLRRHAVELGCPIFGDPKYGAELREQHQGKHAQLMQLLDITTPTLHLHARRLRFVHPFQPTQQITITAPLSPHMMRSFRKLKFDI